MRDDVNFVDISVDSDGDMTAMFGGCELEVDVSNLGESLFWIDGQECTMLLIAIAKNRFYSLVPNGNAEAC